MGRRRLLKQVEIKSAKSLLIGLLLIVSLATIAMAQEDEFPQPRVEVANDNIVICEALNAN